MLGKGHAILLRRAELKTFVDFHGNEVCWDSSVLLDPCLPFNLKLLILMARLEREET